MKLSNQNEAQLVARIEDLKADLSFNFGQICELLTQIKSHYLHKDPMFKWYREVGTGKLLPETVMTFARKPDYLKHLCGYSRETQMSITRCNEFNWCEEFRGEIVEKRTDWKKMSSAAFKRMFPIGGPVRSVHEQRAIVEAELASKSKTHVRQQPVARADGEKQTFSLGTQTVPLNVILGALREIGLEVRGLETLNQQKEVA